MEPGQQQTSGAHTASMDHAVHAFDTLVHHLQGAKGGPPSPPTFGNACCPLFVSWHKVSRLGGDSRLRGCIGTLEPQPLHSAVRTYALTSALRDRRFPPVDAKELPHLRCTVSLLSCFEPAAAWDDWEIGTHGLIIEFVCPHSSCRRTATFLPEVAAHEGWDKQQTVAHLIRKAGFEGSALLVRASLKVTRYQSTAYSLTHEEYLDSISTSSTSSAAAAGRAAAKEGSGRRLPLPKQQPLVTVSASGQ